MKPPTTQTSRPAGATDRQQQPDKRPRNGKWDVIFVMERLPAHGCELVAMGVVPCASPAAWKVSLTASRPPYSSAAGVAMCLGETAATSCKCESLHAGPRQSSASTSVTRLRDAGALCPLTLGLPASYMTVRLASPDPNSHLTSWAVLHTAQIALIRGAENFGDSRVIRLYRGLFVGARGRGESKSEPDHNAQPDCH